MMSMRPCDMLKFRIFYAHLRRWVGIRFLPAVWVKESLTPHSTVDYTAYRYYWWLRGATLDGSYRVFINAAQGNGGQKVYVVPELDLIADFSRSRYNTGDVPPNKSCPAWCHSPCCRRAVSRRCRCASQLSA